VFFIGYNNEILHEFCFHLKRVGVIGDGYDKAVTNAEFRRLHSGLSVYQY